MIPGHVDAEGVLARALPAADGAPPAAGVEVRVLQVDLDVGPAAEVAAAQAAAPLGQQGSVADLGVCWYILNGVGEMNISILISKTITSYSHS